MNIFQRQEEMFTEDENRKIRELKVMIVGAGGLGTHQAVELQRIGVNKLYIVDYDRIEASNLNRQVLYGKDDIGKNKVNCAANKLRGFGLETKIVSINKKVDKEFEIPEDVDIVFDALDNFNTRLLIAQKTLQKEKIFVHGAVDSWYGQLSVITSEDNKDLLDFFRKNNDIDRAIPAFSPVVSLIASLQVVEGVKVYLGHEDTIKGKLLLIDTKNFDYNVIEMS